ncbi:MAG TPA: agmatine deiminase family protein [Gemmataceae bacterium]|nr:agmatine deiminase family protein [Gemmataceae bacterium]
MPAEWDPHAATWLAWPHHADDWPGKIEPIPWVYAEIVRHLHRREHVHILTHDADTDAAARAVLTRAMIDFARVTLHPWPTDRVWTRDSGPTFLVGAGGQRSLLDWHFNAWAKYPNWHDDDAIPGRIAAATGLPVGQPMWNGRRVVLEGGSIDVNGRGLLLTTEECLLSDVQCRNPGMTRADYERVFAEYLGVKKVLWLDRGIVGDDTHGHVDDLARFVGPRTVVTAVEADPAEDNYGLLQENLHRLRGMTDLDGAPLEVVTLPMPKPVWFDGQRLPASYANFYIANGLVLVPTFNDANDRHALNTLAGVFPGREVVGIHCGDLVYGLGTLHCMTQQEPAGRAPYDV